jgi:hypothetical protein
MAFAGNSFCVYAATVGLFGMSNKDVSALYPTLVTPAFWGFLIWPVIFGLQGCFTLLQLLPQYREEPMLVNGISYYYAVACVFQGAWAVIFSHAMLETSLVMVIGTLVALVLLERSSAKYPPRSMLEFVVFRAPFGVHQAWMWVVVLVGINLIAVERSGGNRPLEIAVAAGSFCVLGAVALHSVLREGWLIPAVVSWAFWSISDNIVRRSAVYEERYGEEARMTLVAAARALAVLSLGSTVVLALRMIREMKVLVMLSPQLDFDATDESVVLPQSSARDVNTTLLRDHGSRIFPERPNIIPNILANIPGETELPPYRAPTPGPTGR